MGYIFLILVVCAFTLIAWWLWRINQVAEIRIKMIDHFYALERQRIDAYATWADDNGVVTWNFTSGEFDDVAMSYNQCMLLSEANFWKSSPEEYQKQMLEKDKNETPRPQ